MAQNAQRDGEGFDPSPDLLLPPLSPRAELAILARALYREGYEEHIAGHISYKQPDGTLLVNPYHLRWDEVRAEHICRIDVDGNKLEGDWFVSTAIELHLQLHKFREDVTVAVHNHPRWGTVWASLRRVPPVHDQTSCLVDNDIALHDEYDRPVGDASEARGAIETLGKGKAAILSHHGVLVVGDDVGQIYARCMSLEWRCRMAWHVEALGGAPAMPAEASQRLARGIDRRGYPGLWEAMARQEIQLDPRVLPGVPMNAPVSNLARLAERQQRTDTVTFIPEPEPDELFAPIVSVDDHVLEPPSLFEGRVPARYADDAPHVEYDDDGVPFWIVDGRRLPILFSNGAAGRVLEEWKGASRCKFDEFRPSVSDGPARLLDMDVAGVWASLCFGSTIWGFAGTRFSKFKDPDLGLACLRAYNDWMYDEWCATDRDRLIPCQLPWFRDPEVAAAEIRRNAERGVHAVSFSENPEGLGFPSLYDVDAWDPFFAACAETGTVVNLHVGSAGRVSNPSADSPPEVIAALFPVSGIETIVDWIYAKVPVRHPGLDIVLSEAGLSWVPMVIERLRRAQRSLAASEVWTADDPHPIELLHRNFWFASLEDPSGFRMLDVIGEDHVMVETDFPHMDSTWPGCQEMIRGELSHLERPTIAKVCYENACRLYQHPLPPESWIERATMGGR